MNTKTLTTLALVPTLLLGSLLSTAAANPRGTVRGETDRTQSADRPHQTPRPTRFLVEMAVDEGGCILPIRPTTGPFNPFGNPHDDGTLGPFMVTVNGEEFAVALEGDSRQGALELYDSNGDFIVGYVAGRRGSVLFDANGLVERSSGPLSVEAMQDYGAAAMLFSDPYFLQQFLLIGTPYDEDDVTAAYPWLYALGAAILRCGEISLSATVDSEGNWSFSGSIGWDCN